MLKKKAIAVLLGASMTAALLGGCSFSGSSGKTINLTVWTYYNGDQLASFERLVDEFNKTVGEKENIVVTSSSQGSVNDLETNVLASAEGKVDALDMPNIFSAYADTAYALDQMGQVVDLSPYLTDDEKDAYISNYLEEGDFSDDGSIRIFPSAKSTELLFLNDTDWQEFSEATGASYDDLATIEGLVSTSELYYNWTDAQTPEENDGKALFGRDAMANYMLVGAKELGCTIFDVQDGKMTLNFDHDVVRKLWDNYYVPFVKGYFAASGHFRSDDIKTGNILAYAGSTSSATFFPDQVSTSDSDTHDITMKVLPSPHFADGEPYAVQQGAGMVVTQGSEEEIKACVTFLKWFTEPENNITFSVESGYLPVTKEANDMDVIREHDSAISSSMDEILSSAVDAINNCKLYTTKPFETGKDARSTLDDIMSDQATADRAVVEERMSEGQTLDEAASEFLTDDYFETWYNNALASLSAYADN